MATLRDLWKNNNLVITRPDKGNATVVLNRQDYVKKMLIILNDKSPSGVEFSFDDTMYRQTDGVAMVSPLGPVLADIFVGWCESRIMDETWPHMYCRFVDDAFSHFADREGKG